MMTRTAHGRYKKSQYRNAGILMHALAANDSKMEIPCAH